MNYTVAGLKNTGFMNVSSRHLFGGKTGIQMAEELGRPTSNSPALTLEQQIKVANFVYGLDPKAAALGNKAPANNQSLNENDNEGWRYRGRGMLQITGKDNYTKIEKHVNEVLKSNVLNIKDGRKGSEIFTLTEALLSGLGDWHMHKMYVPAEAGVTKEACLGVIKIINSATKSKTKRIAHLIGGNWYQDDDTHKTPKEIKFSDSMASIFKVSECNQEGELTNEACTEDCSQCFNYADVWENPEISSDNGGKNNNRYGTSTRGHKGIDILSGPNYKDVHSLMCGTVEKIVSTFKTNEYGHKKLGNVVNVRSKDKNGNIVYILYCHLDKIYVREGQKVRHGQKLALSGSTGNAAEILDKNGNLLHGIWRKNWHVHIEACTNGAGAVTFFGKNRLQPEDYMKTKFDRNGNAIN